MSTHAHSSEAKLHEIGSHLLEKLEATLRSRAKFGSITGGKFRSELSPIVLFGIPIWFHKRDDYLFVTENGAFLTSKSLWGDFERPVFFESSEISSIAAGGSARSKKLKLSFSTGYAELECSVSFIEFLSVNSKFIESIAPWLTLDLKNNGGVPN